MSGIERRTQLSEGKSKILYETNHPEGHLIQYFKDDATAFNALKKGQIHDKGVVNCAVSTWVFQYLEKQGIPTHFVEQSSEREMLVRRVKILPVEVVLRNIAAGSICKRLGLEKGRRLSPALVEYFYKSDPLGDPLIGEGHILYFGWATKEQLEQMTKYCHEVNRILTAIFSEIGLDLVDYKLEFGIDNRGKLLLADEFTADGCRLWDKKTGEPMDKDRFRHDLGRVEESYREVYERLKDFFKGKL